MKAHLFLASAFILTLASCSEDAPETPTNTSQNLARTEKFSPSVAAYEAGLDGSTKKIIYFEDNRPAADSIFDHNGALIEWTHHSYTATTHTSLHRSSVAFNEFDRTETFDNSGRLVQIYHLPLNPPNAPLLPTTTVLYEYGAGNVTQKSVDPNTGLVMENYNLIHEMNADGLIYYSNHGNNAYSEIVYSGGKPVTYRQFNGQEFFPDINCSYYGLTMPANMQKSVAELNNIALLNSYEADAADKFNHYLQTVDWTDGNDLEFERTFNANNYQTYCRTTGSFRETTYDSETFFYYE